MEAWMFIFGAYTIAEFVSSFHVRIPAHRGHSFRGIVGTDSGTIVGSDSG